MPAVPLDFNVPKPKQKRSAIERLWDRIKIGKDIDISVAQEAASEYDARLAAKDEALRVLQARVEADVLACLGMWNDAQFRGAPESWRKTIIEVADSGRIALAAIEKVLP